jgi:hypothetical protein
MENLSECIAVIVTAGIGALIRYFEKKRMLKEQKDSDHFKK